MARNRFKLSFRCTTLITMRGSQRALILGVAKIPGNDGWLKAMLALDDGTMMQSPISLVEFNAAAKAEVTLLEADGERAPSIIYPSESRADT